MESFRKGIHCSSSLVLLLPSYFLFLSFSCVLYLSSPSSYRLSCPSSFSLKGSPASLLLSFNRYEFKEEDSKDPSFGIRSIMQYACTNYPTLCALTTSSKGICLEEKHQKRFESVSNVKSMSNTSK